MSITTLLSVTLALMDLAVAAEGTPPSTTAEPPRKRVLVLDLAALGVDADTTRIIADSVAASVAADRQLDVVSGADLRSLVDVEAEKRALGCEADESCLAEIAGALSADLVVSGSVGKLGSLVVVNLSLYDGKRAESVAKQKVSAERVEELPRQIDIAVAALFGRAAPPAGSGASPLLLAGAGVGVVGVVGAVVTGIGTFGAYEVQRQRDSAGADKEVAERNWPLLVGGVAASAAVLVAGGALVVLAVVDGT